MLQRGKTNQRMMLIVIILTTAALLGYGYYLEFVEYLIPCPLCITQRLFYFLTGLFALLGLFAVGRVWWQRLMAFFMIASVAGGLVTAGRQVWLQHLPKDQVPECGPGLAYWVQNMPVMETLNLLFKGDGNCAEVDWTFLGFSIAEWSLAWFVAFLLAALWLFACGRRLRTY